MATAGGKALGGGNAYQTLGCAPGASEVQIRAAFRAAALAHHPDRNPNDPGAAARFLRVRTALEQLLDPATRRALDQSLGRPAPSRRAAPPRASATRVSARDRARMDQLRRKLAAEEARAGRRSQPAAETWQQRQARVVAAGREQGGVGPREAASWLEEEEAAAAEQAGGGCTVLVKWRAGEWDEPLVRRLLGKYGQINCVLIRQRKKSGKGKAIVEFATSEQASAALYAKLRPARGEPEFSVAAPNDAGVWAETLVTQRDLESVDALLRRRSKATDNENG